MWILPTKMVNKHKIYEEKKQCFCSSSTILTWRMPILLMGPVLKRDPAIVYCKIWEMVGYIIDILMDLLFMHCKYN